MADPTSLGELFPFLGNKSDKTKIERKIKEIYAQTDKINCDHHHHYINGGLKICGDCGYLMDQITYEKDWKSYGNSSSRGTQDSGKAKRHKGINKELKDLGFSQNVAEIANKFYQEITQSPNNSKKKIFRSNNRNALMAVCAFFAHIEVGKPRSSKFIKERFKDLEQKKFNDQLDQFYEKFPEKRCTYVEAKHLVGIVLQKVGILEPEHYRRVKYLCEFLDQTSDLMASSKPESKAAAIVYLHLCISPGIKQKLALNKSSFAKKVDLSDATIDKLLKDAILTLDSKVKIDCT